jgi:uncharacterized membrane protein SirB2
MDLLKAVHVGCAVLSAAGFALRAVWMLRASPRLQARPTRILPHVVDTALLVSAILLSLRLHQYPFTHAWLTAKVLALVLYVVLGSIALKRGRTRHLRVLALAGALATLAYIFAVALTRSPLPGVPV